MLVAPFHASAQTVQTFEDLALRVNLGDQLRVADESGRQSTGRLTRLTADEIVLLTDAGEQRFMRGDVREVAVRSFGLRRGAIIGAGAFAVLSVVATCAHGEERCALVAPVAAVPGAGVGLAFGALIPRMRPVYRASGSRAPTGQPSGGVQAGPAPDLALRINLDDSIEVEDVSGARTVGRLTRVTADALVVHSGAGDTSIARDSVRRVAVRERPLRMAVLVGAGVGATIAAVAACKGPDREECADGPILAGGLGAGAGLAVGALMHKATAVYPESSSQVVIAPILSREAIGVSVRRQW